MIWMVLALGVIGVFVLGRIFVFSPSLPLGHSHLFSLTLSKAETNKSETWQDYADENDIFWKEEGNFLHEIHSILGPTGRLVKKGDQLPESLV